MDGDLTISVTARLVAGASAANWGISLYNHKAEIDDFTTPVPLTGGEALRNSATVPASRLCYQPGT